MARCTLTSFCATKAKGSPHLKYKVERSIDEEKEDKEPVIPMLAQLSFLTKRTTPTCMCGRVESRFAAVKRQVGQCENTRAAWQLFFTARTWAKPHRFDSSVTLLLRRVVQSKTQWHSNVLKLLKLLQKSSQASKTFFQLLQIKRLQLKLTNNLQNSYQISSQHQVPKTWVKQHPKTPKTTKTNENPSPSSSMHKLVPFGSKLVPTWFL